MVASSRGVGERGEVGERGDFAESGEVGDRGDNSPTSPLLDSTVGYPRALPFNNTASPFNVMAVTLGIPI